MSKYSECISRLKDKKAANDKSSQLKDLYNKVQERKNAVMEEDVVLEEKPKARAKPKSKPKATGTTKRKTRTKTNARTKSANVSGSKKSTK